MFDLNTKPHNTKWVDTFGLAPRKYMIEFHPQYTYQLSGYNIGADTSQR